MVPSQLSEKFLEIARVNTAANIETCGILAGKLVSLISSNGCVIEKFASLTHALEFSQMSPTTALG